jgi:hypothetical protein
MAIANIMLRVTTNIMVIYAYRLKNNPPYEYIRVGGMLPGK